MIKRIIITEILLTAYIINLRVWLQESVAKTSTNYKVERNILYRDKTAPEFTEYMLDSCLLNLYYQEQYKNFAIVVWFHGGGLSGGECFISDQLKNQKLAVVDEFASLFHVRPDAPPLVLITGDRNLEFLGRYEENACLMRMMKVIGHQKTQLYELQGFNNGKMVEPGLVLLLKHVHEVISPFPGKKTTFHSYDRYDFTLNGRKYIIVTPKIFVKTKPWI